MIDQSTPLSEPNYAKLYLIIYKYMACNRVAMIDAAPSNDLRNVSSEAPSRHHSSTAGSRAEYFEPTSYIRGVYQISSRD